MNSAINELSTLTVDAVYEGYISSTWKRGYSLYPNINAQMVSESSIYKGPFNSYTATTVPLYMHIHTRGALVYN